MDGDNIKEPPLISREASKGRWTEGEINKMVGEVVVKVLSTGKMGKLTPKLRSGCEPLNTSSPTIGADKSLPIIIQSEKNTPSVQSRGDGNTSNSGSVKRKRENRVNEEGSYPSYPYLIL